MSEQNQNNFATIPDRTLNLKIEIGGGAARSESAHTVVASFDSVKHLLSDKPLRRPPRSRPLPLEESR
jgi:hypothetical protein